jgi:hypothetical protein
MEVLAMGRETCNAQGQIIEQYNQTKPAYGGQPLRIKPYWTESALVDSQGYSQTWTSLGEAGDIFRKHSLSLDLGSLNGYKFIFPYIGSIYFGARNEKDELTKIRSLINISPSEENRLLVVFAHIDSPHSGKTILEYDWLP